jgi:hypothetical protein
MIGRLVALYPRGWRERYGAEVAGLTRELVAAGQVSRLRAGLDLVSGAAGEWRRLAVRQVNLAPAAAAAVGVTLVVRATAGGGARRPYFDSHPASWLVDLAELALPRPSVSMTFMRRRPAVHAGLGRLGQPRGELLLQRGHLLQAGDVRCPRDERADAGRPAAMPRNSRRGRPSSPCPEDQRIYRGQLPLKVSVPKQPEFPA